MQVSFEENAKEFITQKTDVVTIKMTNVGGG
ncbi:hypothetical protein H0A61_00841 [Koleobacter methoxysyntrophicus]|jgi:hypothetical protein|uniref:Uncharacterized protein n=2 Tax=Koleobacter methoxysyntrophicus TaxID=2751313 RepID=A0A8A0RL95_9FIRM|nr:hypothetical protein H0A61_00841 [Koleobacter methoxysyntrophicus]